MASLPPNSLPAVLEQLIHAGHSHGHSHSHVATSGADPIALWVSAASIAVKEWLFRASSALNPIVLIVAKKVALETNSTVLLANVLTLPCSR